MSTKQERLAVFKETMKAALSESYPIGRNKECEIEGTDDMMNTTKFYRKRIEIDESKLNKSYTESISVRTLDSLEAAKELLNQGFRPAVLNMASFHTPGGGVERGSQAQEEIICRRTNLLLSLYQFHEKGEDYGIPQSQERYPLACPFGAIYTPQVAVFRDTDERHYEFINEPWYVDIITIASLKRPKLTNEGNLTEKDASIIKSKIEQMLSIALENGNDSVVLGAFGCGAYANPPHHVAKIFYDVLINNPLFKNAFQEVVFAILENACSFKEHNKEGNIKPFVDVFGESLIIKNEQ